jgi:hypothetical protein
VRWAGSIVVGCVSTYTDAGPVGRQQRTHCSRNVLLFQKFFYDAAEFTDRLPDRSCPPFTLRMPGRCRGFANA